MKVFLSSTAQDLVAHRRVADDTILCLSHSPVAMERFGPLPGEPVAECERKARESDIVVCIVAHRYGFVPEKGRGSITQREVEAAKAAGKDILVFIVADDHPWSEKKEQDLLTDPTVLADPSRVAEVVEGVAGLGAFKTWLRKTFVCDTFTTPEELGRKIAIALPKHVQQQKPHATLPALGHGEIRIVHALQPAPHFHGREALLTDLTAWVANLDSPDRVWSLVATGGTGKTAVVERVVRDLQPGRVNVIVWSFYEKPDADAFLHECAKLFLIDYEGPAGSRTDRFERCQRDGRPYLLVLDGLERVQAEAGGGHVRGEIPDQTLKLLLQAFAAGIGHDRARALVTSRLPLVDLQDWTNCGYRDTRLDDLTQEAAVAVLQGWGVVGEEVALRSAATQVGNHALSVAVLGSYLRSFANGRIEEVEGFDLDTVTGEDPKAAKLARVLAFYAERLPPEERELLARLSVFPRGVPLKLLSVLVDAGGEVAGLLARAKPRLAKLLNSLKARGLVFEYIGDKSVIWTAHPFLREKFRHLLGCPAEKVFDVVARDLGTGLEERPETKPIDPSLLDRYELLIEATRLAGREQEAFDLYWYDMGGYGHIGWVLGEYQRGFRILASFSATGQPEDLGHTMAPRERSLLANDLSLFADKLGHLDEAWAIRKVNYVKEQCAPRDTSRELQNLSRLVFARGRLSESRAMADEALTEAEAAKSCDHEVSSLSLRAIAAHALGDISAARKDFSSATRKAEEPLWSLRGSNFARHLLDLGHLSGASALCNRGIQTARRDSSNLDFPRFHALLARIDLSKGNDPTHHLCEVRTWASRTGEMQHLIEAHLLTARHLLASGDLQAALCEADDGLLHAVSCGYTLLRIELLVVLSRIQLPWPHAPKGIQAAREALDLATHPDCKYAWGEADAAQAWGEAYFASHEPTLAKRAFSRALEVRKRIEHPGVAETERWLALVE